MTNQNTTRATHPLDEPLKGILNDMEYLIGIALENKDEELLEEVEDTLSSMTWAEQISDKQANRISGMLEKIKEEKQVNCPQNHKHKVIYNKCPLCGWSSE